MANPEHLRLLKHDVGSLNWNAWRKANPAIQPDLSGADLTFAELSGTDLTGANLSAARLLRANLTLTKLSGTNLSGAELEGLTFIRQNLTGANLIKANLIEANLFATDLSGSDLTMANLRSANLNMAKLRGVNLSGSHLVSVNLTQADLSGANLSKSKIGDTTFGDVDLRTVKGLETIQHLGPSTIGIDTIYRSQGKIPEIFLRGAGVPEVFITNMPSLVAAMSPIEFYSCFISYSSKDQEFAERLYTDLQAKGVRCWYAPEDLKIGDKFRQRIDDAIRLHDKLLVVLSDTSVASSWVEKEVETAFEKEQGSEKKVVLFPIRLDEAVMKTSKAWAADIRRMRHIGDFSRWQDHNSYKKAFERLLRDLQGDKREEATTG